MNRGGGGGLGDVKKESENDVHVIAEKIEMT